MADSWDETDVTDIEICPDGRIHILGASQEVMGVLRSLGWQDGRERRRRNCGRSMTVNDDVVRASVEGSP